MKLMVDNVTILGGDARSVALGKLFQEDGKHVTIYGFDSRKDTTELTYANTLKQSLDASKVIIAPLPFVNDKYYLNTPLYSETIKLKDVFANMNETQILLGGHIPEKCFDLAEEYGVTLIDYFAREELQVLNAIPTAEGTIQLAMEKMDTTIHGSHVMVLGFGRIGKTVAHMLSGLGAQVHVAARKHADIAWITLSGYNPVFLQNIEADLHKPNLIINTIPATVLDGGKLEKLSKDVLIIDIASSPGGVDFAAAKNLGIETVWALGLPGKVAPLSAARCIRETVYNIMYDVEVYE